uniref:Uncharacterized protein n=1 Tax=Picea glauca TaxID=3330 RepID=A0A117NI25_PICGL|nr:hypothetical protein ABT39_MTgene3799 [Picea glauca]
MVRIIKEKDTIWGFLVDDTTTSSIVCTHNLWSSPNRFMLLLHHSHLPNESKGFYFLRSLLRFSR